MFIRLNGIKIFAHHGVYEEEIRSGNHFEIDIAIELPDTPGTTSDALNDTLDYTKMAAAVREISGNRRYNLLEAFAHDIGKKILADFSEIKNITIKIRKLNPPMDGGVKNVEIELDMKPDA